MGYKKMLCEKKKYCHSQRRTIPKGKKRKSTGKRGKWKEEKQKG